MCSSAQTRDPTGGEYPEPALRGAPPRHDHEGGRHPSPVRCRVAGIRIRVCLPWKMSMSFAGTRPTPGTPPAKADGLSEARREAALLKTGALQNAILTSANFSIIATDEKGVIQLFNVGAERMLGYQAAEVVNRINPSDIHDPQEVLARALALSEELGTTITPGFEALAFKASRGIEDIYELTYICKDGSRFPAIVSITALRDDFGAIIGYLLIGTDNSVRKQVESKLNEAMAAAEKANRAKTDFLSGMSHELRTPLNAILGFAQLMDSGTPLPTPSQKRSLDQILKAGWYLLELINEILDLALIESGKVMLSSEPVSLVEVMLECRAMIEPQAQKRGISMTFPRLETPYYVKADRTRVKQVLINLLFNAIKYNRAAGAVVVECVPSPPDSIRIRVRDTGMGLSADQIAQLFQPFNRLGKEASVEEGTGIGLVVTKRLVELMGGAIGVESTVGVGSTFWIDLGLATAQQFTAPEAAQLSLVPAQSPEALPRRTLLYVEDNPANLELVEQLIARRPDLRLLSAADGNLGVEFARAYLPDVILMDIHLPGLSGIEALKILRADPTTAHIPIIALSANAVPRYIEMGLDAGFFDYLTKPIKVNLFMEALDVALQHSRTASARTAVKERT
jgi:PAS domain S-box-containing protein